jgi:hypothetical protein
MTSYDVFINKYLIIFKRDNTDPTEVGDVLRFKSDVVECNLVANKILYYVGPSGSPKGLTSGPVTPPYGSDVDKYIYCYGDFNQNIINNLKKLSLTVSVTNLNKYSTISELLDSFEYHPVGIGYKLSNSNDELTVDQRFNNKTAYYNMQSEVIVDSVAKETLTPAASNAACRNPRSAVSQRAEEAASGRITPTKPSAASSLFEQPVSAIATAAITAVNAIRRFDIDWNLSKGGTSLVNLFSTR